MNWQDARSEALDKWFAIRDLVGLCEPEKMNKPLLLTR